MTYPPFPPPPPRRNEVRNQRKFVTTQLDHERGKRVWGLPIPHSLRKVIPFIRPRSAVDPDWLRRWIEKNGPYLMHETTGNDVRDKILKEGLIPHDQGPGSKYQGFLTPRANHSYARVITRDTDLLKTKYDAQEAKIEILKEGRPSAVAIDLRKLDPSRINADEDAFTHNVVGNSRFGLPVPDRDDRPGEHHAIDKNGTYPHLGAWADHYKLNRPEHTAHSLNSFGTAAIYGGVSPEALVAPEVAAEELREHWPTVFNRRPSGYGKDPLLGHQVHFWHVPYEYMNETPQMAWEFPGTKAASFEDLVQHAYNRTRDNGGVTIGLNGEEPGQGYAYSAFPELERIIPAQLFTPVVLQQYVDDNTEALALPAHYLGVWHDSESGNVILDVSKVGDAHPDTIAEAAKAKQIAVYDLAGGHSLPTGVAPDRSVTSSWDMKDPALFSPSADPIRPIDYQDGEGQYWGKGMTTVRGRELEWYVHPDNWGPHHMNVADQLRDFSLKTWVILPNGERKITFDPNGDNDDSWGL